MNDGYRAELEAAYARIAALEERLAARSSRARVHELERERRAIRRRLKKGFTSITRRYNALGALVTLFFVLLSIPIGHVIGAQLVFWSLVMAVPSFAFAAGLARRAHAVARADAKVRIAEIDEQLEPEDATEAFDGSMLDHEQSNRR